MRKSLADIYFDEIGIYAIISFLILVCIIHFRLLESSMSRCEKSGPDRAWSIHYEVCVKRSELHNNGRYSEVYNIYD